ncbi:MULTISPECIES: GNAT family N-acetyltransferase [Staphylococcus]|uniref:GNAT family N-acetyltransferase n=1 Tax=Staphylococcus succinus TaxID=61015 RepID=A0ABX5IJX8_9STAP|nr:MULTISPECIES: GNAT family N-acetyltransferase [Staphylococcus]MDW8544590.1 GNAT family N-acetyltransferase [Staphylococcus pseudoxylosus]MEB7463564.1 GNAT family N-acetyltransferase [Staphylococcus succinus]PTI38992.1 GNAT family N-acetyltransferase [Staphylococcus succinus]PTI67335.1 GNAT family N-acetyltransferase [Staphylococcus succinus]RIN35066.1 GNAT family N-acetyltransferase [Staphylococcus succinus]
MIRAYKENDIGILIDIWYKGSLQAHNFIDSGYWESQMEEMRGKYIPMSETHVITNQIKIIGFISMVEDYLAALFIDVAYQNNGAGKELLNFEKEQRNKIQLKVYKENLSAVRFYEKNGFIIKKELTDEQTNKQEYLMEWTKN